MIETWIIHSFGTNLFRVIFIPSPNQGLTTARIQKENKEMMREELNSQISHAQCLGSLELWTDKASETNYSTVPN